MNELQKHIDSVAFHIHEYPWMDTYDNSRYILSRFIGWDKIRDIIIKNKLLKHGEEIIIITCLGDKLLIERKAISGVIFFSAVNNE